MEKVDYFQSSIDIIDVSDDDKVIINASRRETVF